MMSHDPRIVRELQLSEVRVLPKAVNFHFIPHCNYGCKFCFATFNDIPSRSRLSKEDTLKIPALLANAGAEKIYVDNITVISDFNSTTELTKCLE